MRTCIHSWEAEDVPSFLFCVHVVKRREEACEEPEVRPEEEDSFPLEDGFGLALPSRVEQLILGCGVDFVTIHLILM